MMSDCRRATHGTGSHRRKRQRLVRLPLPNQTISRLAPRFARFPCRSWRRSSGLPLLNKRPLLRAAAAAAAAGAMTTEATGRETGAGRGAQAAGTDRAALGGSSASARGSAAQRVPLSGAPNRRAGAVLLTPLTRTPAATETTGTGVSHHRRRSAGMRRGPGKVLTAVSGIATSGQSTGAAT